MRGWVATRGTSLESNSGRACPATRDYTVTRRPVASEVHAVIARAAGQEA